jgi:hypothetical protein
VFPIKVQKPGFIINLAIRYLLNYTQQNRRPEILLAWVGVVYEGEDIPYASINNVIHLINFM